MVLVEIMKEVLFVNVHRDSLSQEKENIARVSISVEEMRGSMKDLKQHHLIYID